MFGMTSCGTVERGATVSVQKSTEVSYFKAKGTLTVTDVTTDFYPASGKVLRDPKDDGKQFVRIGLHIENTGEEQFGFNFTTLRFNTSDGEGSLPSLLINKSNADDILKSKDLASGESIDGALYFEAPASDTLDNMSLVFQGYEGTTQKDYTIPLK